jgi:hypothetical protein
VITPNRTSFERNTNDQEIALRDIANRPSEIDYDLETAVINWERAINDYREYEASELSEGYSGARAVLEVLEDLRENPSKYLNNERINVRMLARKRATIFKWQLRLGLDKLPSSPQTKDEIPSADSSRPNYNKSNSDNSNINSVEEEDPHTGLSPMHDNTGGFDASVSGSGNFNATSLGLRGITEGRPDDNDGNGDSNYHNHNHFEDNEGPLVPPDPLLFMSMNTLDALSRDTIYAQKKNSSVVRIDRVRTKTTGSVTDKNIIHPPMTPLQEHQPAGGGGGGGGAAETPVGASGSVPTSERRRSGAREESMTSSQRLRGQRPSLRESLFTPRRSGASGSESTTTGAKSRPGSLTPSGSRNISSDLGTLGEALHSVQRSGKHHHGEVAGGEEGEDVSVTRVLSLTWAGRLNEVNSTQGSFHISSSIKSQQEQSFISNEEVGGSEKVERTSSVVSTSSQKPGVASSAFEGSSDKASTLTQSSLLEQQARDALERDSVDVTQNQVADGGGGSKVSVVSNHAHQIKPKWPRFLQEVWYDVVKWNNYGAKQRRIIKLTEYHILNIKGEKTISKLYSYTNIQRIWLESPTMFKLELKDNTRLCYISQMAPTIVQQITTRVQVRLALEKTVFSSMPHGGAGEAHGGPEYSQEAASKLIETITQDHENESHDVLEEFAITLMKNIPVYGTLANKRAGKRDNTAAADDASKRPTLKSMISLPEDSPEYRVRSELQKIVFDDATDEGNTRRVFLEDFDESKTLVNVRHFIDGLHEYLLTERGVHFAMFYMDDSYGVRRKSLADQKRDSTRRASIRGFGSVSSLEQVDEDSLAIISFISFNVVEESVFLPLKDTILRMLPSQEYHKGRDEALRRKVKHFKKRTQAGWNVPEEFISPTGWESAIFELSGLARAPTPSMQINSLVRCCKSIYSEFKHSVLPALKKKGNDQSFLGADDLVPIFIYVFCKAELREPHVHKDLMWNLCHPDQLHGECGYYLTVFESAIEYVEAEPLEDEDDDRYEGGEEMMTTTSTKASMGGGATYNNGANDGDGRDRARSRGTSMFNLFTGSGDIDNASSNGKHNAMRGESNPPGRQRQRSIVDMTMSAVGMTSGKYINETTFDEGDEDM